MKEVEEIIKRLNDCSLQELELIYSETKRVYREIYYSKYKDVCIYPGEKISHIIEKETGFKCRWVPCEEYSAGRGTHKIQIPLEKYSESLEKELVNKYNSY